jgi:hypothetical protein
MSLWSVIDVRNSTDLKVSIAIQHFHSNTYAQQSRVYRGHTIATLEMVLLRGEDGDQFFNYFRMSAATFAELLSRKLLFNTKMCKQFSM